MNKSYITIVLLLIAGCKKNSSDNPSPSTHTNVRNFTFTGSGEKNPMQGKILFTWGTRNDTSYNSDIGETLRTTEKWFVGDTLIWKFLNTQNKTIICDSCIGSVPAASDSGSYIVK